MAEHMDPATGMMINDDQQPDPNVGGMAGQQVALAAASPPPIVPPPTPDAPPIPVTGPPTPDLPPMQLPEPSLPLPGAPSVVEPGLPPMPALGVPPAPGEPPTGIGDNLIPSIVPKSPDAPMAPGLEPPVPVVPADKADDLTQQQVEARQQKADLEKQEAEAKAAAAQAEEKIRTDAAKAQADIQRRGEADYAAQRAQYDADYDKYRAMGEKDSWGDNGTAKRIMAGIAILLGGRPAAAIVIGAAKGFEANKAAALQQQAEAMKKDGKDAEEVRAHMHEQMQNLTAQTAAGLDATAARMESELAIRGVPAAQIAANTDIIAVKKAAAEAKEKAQIAAHKQAQTDAHNALVDNQIAASTDLSKARKALIDKKLAGGGGGGGGTDALVKFGEAAGALKPGDPIPASVIDLGRRAGLKPNQIAQEVDRYRASGNKATKLDATASSGDDKDVNKRMDAYEKQAIGNAKSLGPVRVLSQVEAMRNGLSEAVASGDSDRIKAAVIKAKEQAGTLMSGGKLTNAQITILHELDSTVDHIIASIGKFTGNPTEGAGAVRRLSTLIDDAGNETVQQIADIRQRGINEHLGEGGFADTPEKRRTFMNRNNGLYSEVRWQGKPVFDEGKGSGQAPASGVAAKAPATTKDAGAPPSPTALKAKAMKILKATPDSEPAKWVRDNPSDPRSAAIMKKLEAESDSLVL